MLVSGSRDATLAVPHERRSNRAVYVPGVRQDVRLVYGERKHATLDLVPRARSQFDYGEVNLHAAIRLYFVEATAFDGLLSRTWFPLQSQAKKIRTISKLVVSEKRGRSSSAASRDVIVSSPIVSTPSYARKILQQQSVSLVRKKRTGSFYFAERVAVSDATKNHDDARHADKITTSTRRRQLYKAAFHRQNGNDATIRSHRACEMIFLIETRVQCTL